jgi:Cu-processing system permease protein
MNVVLKVARYQLRDLARSRWLFVYAGFFLLASVGLLSFDPGPKAFVGLANLAVFIVPLVSIVFGALYLYNARDYVELLLAQPVSRRQVYAGLYAALASSLAAALVLGIGAGLVIIRPSPGSAGIIATLLGAGVALTLTFVSLAFVLVGLCDDRLKGLSIAIGVWLVTALLYDGVVLFVAGMFSGPALERALLAISVANPVDLARIAVLLQLDTSALMGYTGAVFHQFFAGAAGMVATAAALAGWIAVPALFGARLFRSRDF